MITALMMNLGTKDKRELNVFKSLRIRDVDESILYYQKVDFMLVWKEVLIKKIC